MPRGVYPRKRTPAQLAMWKKNFDKGRTPEVQARAIAASQETMKTEEWREKVSQATTEAMHRPEVRKKHLKGLAKARAVHGVNFKGGQHQEPLDLIKPLIPLFASIGFHHEHKVVSKGHGTSEKTRGYLLVDFGNPDKRIAVEIDGPCHKTKRGKERDKRKTIVLTALGWTIVRFSNEEAQSDPKSLVEKTHDFMMELSA